MAVSYCVLYFTWLHTVGSLPPFTKLLCSCFEFPTPLPWTLVLTQVAIHVGKHAFSTRLFEVKFEEVSYVEKPREVDVLVVLAFENGLFAVALVHMLLGIIEPRRPSVGRKGIQRKMQEAKLYDEYQRVWMST